MTEINDSSPEEKDITIESLQKENAGLRQKIKELQRENVSLREKLTFSEQNQPVFIEEKKPLKLFKEQKEIEIQQPNILEERDLEISSEFESPSVPISSTHKTIIEGHSRRMCPSCDNTQHQSIYEEIDKTHIIMNYPRIYGKKYKCGKCGQEWRVPTSLE
ncbi:MAG: hypothetical protein ACFFCC_20265 [Promethearchaeota archaeon]